MKMTKKHVDWISENCAMRVVFSDEMEMISKKLKMMLILSLFVLLAKIQICLARDTQILLGDYILRTPNLGGVATYPMAANPPMHVQFFQSESVDFRTPHVLVMRYSDHLNVVSFSDNYLKVREPIRISAQIKISTANWSTDAHSSMGYFLTCENSVLTVVYDKPYGLDCLRTVFRVFDVNSQREVFPETPFFSDDNYCRDPAFPLSVSRSYPNELGSVIVAAAMRKRAQEPRHTVMTRSWLVWPPRYIKPEGRDSLQRFGNTASSQLQSVWVDFDRDGDLSKKSSVVAVTSDETDNQLVSVQTFPVNNGPQSYDKPAELLKKPPGYSLQPFSLFSGNHERTYYYSLVRSDNNVSLAMSVNRNFQDRRDFTTIERSIPVIKNITGFCSTTTRPNVHMAWSDSALPNDLFVDVEPISGTITQPFQLNLGSKYRIKRLLQYVSVPAAKIAVIEMDTTRVLMFAKIYYS